MTRAQQLLLTTTTIFGVAASSTLASAAETTNPNPNNQMITQIEEQASYSKAEDEQQIPGDRLKDGETKKILSQQEIPGDRLKDGEVKFKVNFDNPDINNANPNLDSVY